ncbi:MAG: class I SAM-dependent methyltransferase [Candidatus Thermoplasmatota archaeon]|nr:class I SAM-dependent methyltransferase [Candidatus Thermoplasmatota archaeon]
MNDVSWQLLGFTTPSPLHILDAGCGMGGTSIYLAQKYPQVSFIGITIVPTHVQMAERFSKKRSVTSNTLFLLQNYCHTSFPDNSFDGVIALESANYARSKDDFIREMYRVLKPGGCISILDGFRTKKHIPASVQKLYKIWLNGRALVGLEPVHEFSLGMKQQGFRDILVSDISAHVLSSYFFGVLIGGLFFIPAAVKTIIHSREQKKTDDFECFMAVSLAGALLALYGCFRYYAVSGTK